MAKIKRTPLRQQVRDQIAEMLWSGVWAAGEDLNEAQLARELGVSRTPLREGLLLLASEGLIEARPNRGFHVPGVNSSAVAELYPILGALEALAVTNLSGDRKKIAARLDAINTRIARAESSRKRRYSSDAAWHEALVEHCGNALLRAELKTLWARARTIDGALMRGLADVENSCAEHTQIANEIGRGRLATAARLVKRHWSSGITTVTRWIEETTEHRGGQP